MRVTHKPTILNLCLLSLLFAFTVVGCKRGQKQFHLQGQAQGTYYSILYSDARGRDFTVQIDSILYAFDQVASMWVDSSELRRVNNNEIVMVSPMFADILNKSLSIYQLTDGAFDCTVGKLVNAWGFGFKKREQIDQLIVDSLLSFVGFDKVHLLFDSVDEEWRIVKANKNIELDFNAIAQGYSVDVIADFFNRCGVANYLIDVGGEVIARGGKPDGQAWSVGIERPATGRYDAPEVETIISLTDRAVVTSGSYRKYYENNGLRYSHTISPVTGYPVEHSLLSVTVIDSFSWRADALATSFMVMGLDSSLSFIDRHKDLDYLQSVMFIYSVDTGYRTFVTPEFENYIRKDK